MKKCISSLITFIFICSSPVLSEVFYCSSDDISGFSPAQNYKHYMYNGERFHVKIDWQKETILSEKIFLNARSKCVSSLDTIYCISDLGSTLAVNKTTLKYHRAIIFLIPNMRDDIMISHGTCEKF